MSAYYNENDWFAAAWLRALIKRGLIAPGDVDERSIEEVQPDDLRGYRQAHFFAGIGGWSLAARLAGIGDDEPLWTGSCPCQPFSVAGRGGANADPRHLWPHFRRLIEGCRPAVVAGEQVASKAGRTWCAGVRADLEALGYGFGAADLCAAGVGAPHIRQRLYWVAEPEHVGREGLEARHSTSGALAVEGGHDADGRGVVRVRLGDADGGGTGRDSRGPAASEAGDAGPGHRAGRVGDAAGAPGAAGPWSECVYVPCGDGKARRIEPSIEPLVDGVPARVGRVRAYGNAIVPQLAAEFLMAYMETKHDA